jgi:hypothetical protein
MSGRAGKDKAASPKRTTTKPKRGKPSWPGKDAPFEVDTSEDGDFATPKRDLDEQELKEQEERKS